MTLYSTVCRNPLPESRVVRGSPYCSGECRKAYRQWRRNDLAERRCLLCGGPKRKPKLATEPITGARGMRMPSDGNESCFKEIRPCAPGAQPISCGT